MERNSVLSAKRVPFFSFAFYSHVSYTADEMRWCTVTVTDAEGRRHSVDVQATSSFDAAHLFVVEAKKERAVGLPNPTLATVFEVVPPSSPGL